MRVTEPNEFSDLAESLQKSIDIKSLNVKVISVAWQKTLDYTGHIVSFKERNEPAQTLKLPDFCNKFQIPFNPPPHNIR